MVYTASVPGSQSLLSAIVHLTGGALLAFLRRRRAARIQILVCAALATVLVGVSRVYLGVHWPTDARAGWAGGAAWAALCLVVAPHLQAPGQLELETARLPRKRRVERPPLDSHALTVQ